MLDLIDGLVLTGGADIDPAFYGQQAHAETVDTVPERDAFEIALVRAAIERDLPVLGICRGMQLINVARGGTLLQHLPEHFGHGEHRRAIGSFDGADHDVRLFEGTLAARAAGETEHATKSHHHQGIDRLGEGLVVSGRSTLDELPEAIEWDRPTQALRARRAVASRGGRGELGDRRSGAGGDGRAGRANAGAGDRVLSVAHPRIARRTRIYTPGSSAAVERHSSSRLGGGRGGHSRAVGA